MMDDVALLNLIEDLVHAFKRLNFFAHLLNKCVLCAEYRF